LRRSILTLTTTTTTTTLAMCPHRKSPLEVCG